MLISQKSALVGQQKVHQYVENSCTDDFLNVLVGPELISVVEALQPEHRERIYTPSVTLAMFITQALSTDRSCQKAVDEFAVKRIAQGLPRISSRTGAFCMARQRLPVEMISSLSSHVADLMIPYIKDDWKFNGFNTFIVDGFTVKMPDTPENQAAYPQEPGQKPGLGSPICRSVVITSLETAATIDVATAPYSGKGTGESALLRKMLNNFNKGDLMLGDALFASYFLLAELFNMGVHFLFEQMSGRSGKANFKSGEKLGAKDHIIVLTKPKKKPQWMDQETYDKAPDSLKVREFKSGGKVMTTSLLLPNEAPKKDLSDHYKKRWNVELDIRNIKTTMKMETLSCKTPEMVEKEMWVYFLAYNIIRLLILQSALMCGVLPRQISYKHTIQMWLPWCLMNAKQCIEKRHDLFLLIAQQLVGNRPGRIEPRALKMRPKAYPLLTKPRAEARADVRKNGHPKKTK